MKGRLSYVFILCIILGLPIGVYAQKTDYTWLSGYSGYPHPYFDMADSVFFSSTVLNFNYNPIQVSYDSLQMYFDETNTSYCDTNGNLLFYTDGHYIANSLNETIEGSDSLNQGYYWAQWYPFGYRLAQGILAFQDAANSNRYCLVHSYWDSPNIISDSYITRTLGTLIDLSANNGQGNVVYINKPLIQDTLDASLVATRHGNGRGWWIPVQRIGTNCFYRILLNDTGFQVMPGLNCGGPVIAFLDYGASSFSADGSKFAHFTLESGLTIFDFDRCSGELSNPVYMPSNIWQDSGWGGAGLAFSSNSRFLYVSATKILLQYDLWATDISSSVDTVGKYDGYYSYNSPYFETLFNTAQIGPDGKIYISCGNAVPVYHVINCPDLKGDSCNFQQHSFQLFSPSLGVPNLPNYRLGPLIGSGCDTLTGLSEVATAAKEAILKVFPNPATDLVTIDYGFTNWSITGTVSLEISNQLGQIVYKEELPQYSGFQKLDVTKYAAGVYTAFIKRNEQVKLVRIFE